MQPVNTETNLDRKNLPWIILVVTIPFLYGYFLFFAFHNHIVNCHRPSDATINSVIDPHTTLTTEHDGIEPAVLFLYMLFAGPAGFLLFQSSLSKKILAVIAAVMWMVFVLEVRFFQNFLAQMIADGVMVQWIKTLMVFGPLVWVLYQLYKKIPLLAQFLLAEITLLVCFVPYSDVSYFDYAFVLAPAWKLLHGANIADTYFQYDFLPSLPALLVLKKGWSVYAYRFFVQGGLFVFVIVSFISARKFFVHKSLAFYLFALLIIVRLFMGITEATAIPQSTSMRLDWWLLLFASAHFGGGIDNKKLGACFLLLIVVLNSFAVIYFACYLLLLIFLLALAFYADYKSGRPVYFGKILRDWITKYSWNVLLGFAGLLIYCLITGHVVNESMTMYRDYQLGMLPVTQCSSYWYFAGAFALCFALLLTFRKAFDEKYFEQALFLLALCLGSSVYFFGRSHENNIINISGVLLFVLLLCCDVLLILMRGEESETDSTTKVLGLTPVWLIFIVMMVNNAGLFSANFGAFMSSLKSGQWTYVDSHPEPGALQTISALTKGDRKVYFMIFDAEDFYFYYRGKYDMPTKYNPVDALVILSDKIAIINQKLEEGYYVAGLETDYMVKSAFMPKLHFNNYLSNGRYFVIHK